MWIEWTWLERIGMVGLGMIILIIFWGFYEYEKCNEKEKIKWHLKLMTKKQKD